MAWGRIRTNAGILLIGPIGTNFSEILIAIHIFSFTEMHLKMSTGKWRPFCASLNVLNKLYSREVERSSTHQFRCYQRVNFVTAPDDVIKLKHFPLYWPFVRGIHRSPVNSPHKVQWRGTLMFSLIWAWTNGWVNNHEAGDLRRHRAHYDVTIISNSLRVQVSIPAREKCNHIHGAH